MLQPKSAFTRRLAEDRPSLLDGGLATQLEAQGCDLNNALWSAALLENDPAAIVAAHRAYLDAGAECIATASYQASREGFAGLGKASGEADELMRLSVELARQARDAAGSDALIAGSLGPYGAMLHDGSEYRGDYGVTADVLRVFHEPRLRLFDATDVDVIAIETVPSFAEAEVLSELLWACATPAWVSFSCRDEKCISDGTPLAAAAKLFAAHPVVVAVGINCTPPQFVPALIGEVKSAAPGKAIAAYPNSGETYNAADNSWSGTVTPGDCAVAALEWLEAGARIIGGCCRMGPAHIRAMASLLNGMR